jgi:hypothetical protein
MIKLSNIACRSNMFSVVATSNLCGDHTSQSMGYQPFKDNSSSCMIICKLTCF